jgi:hypothetical protein
MSVEDMQLAADFIGITPTSERLADVPLKKITCNLARNPRDEGGETYKLSFPPMAKLVRSMKDEGYLPGQRVLLHQNTMAHQGNLNLEMVIGHRRFFGAGYAGLEKIPAVIITGLTNRQIYNLIVDPVRVEYGPIGEFKAVRDLILNEGLGQGRIMDRLNLKSNQVQEYRCLSKLPEPLIEAWFKQKRGGDKKVPFNINREAILSLYAAKLRDEGGTNPTFTPEGVKLAKTIVGKEEVDSGLPACFDVNGGPEYWAAYELLKNPAPKTVPAFTPASVKALADSCSNQEVRDLLLGISGDIPNPGQHLNTVKATVGRYDYLKKLSITEPHLAMLIKSIGPDASDVEKDRFNVLVKGIVDAIELYFDLHPERDPLPVWAKEDAPETPVDESVVTETPVIETPVIETPIEPESVVTETPVKVNGKKGKKVNA